MVTKIAAFVLGNTVTAHRGAVLVGSSGAILSMPGQLLARFDHLEASWAVRNKPDYSLGAKYTYTTHHNKKVNPDTWTPLVIYHVASKVL